MPVISEFYGIRIKMFWNDHLPPHFHAEYDDTKILVDINMVCVIKGIIPFKQLKLVLAWCEIHKDELLLNWENSLIYQAMNRISPLI